MVQFNPWYILVFPLLWCMHGYHYDNIFIVYMKRRTIIPNCTKTYIKPQHLISNRGFFQLGHVVSSKNYGGWMIPRHNFQEFSLKNSLWRQRGRVVRAPDLKSGGDGFKSRSDHLAGVVSRWTLVQLLGHACI